LVNVHAVSGLPEARSIAAWPRSSAVATPITYFAWTRTSGRGSGRLRRFCPGRG